MYNKLLKRLYQTEKLGMKFGLENILKLDFLMGFPSKKFKSIHVAGTNGKGSVATKLSSALSFSGHKVGLFTSPHVFSFLERIQINNEKISKEKVVDGLSKIFEIIDKENFSPTFFEINSILAFYIFANEKVDFAVIETGLGGRLDSTNIITPILSVITSISLDHTSILGSTIEQIAMEKAGIIKKGIPVVLGPTAQLNQIKDVAANLGSECHFTENINGWYDQINSKIASNCLKILKKNYFISDEAILKGLEKRPFFRFEEIDLSIKKPSEKFFKFPEKIIFDVAHNEAGFENLFRALKIKYPDKKTRLILGISKDKDIKLCVKIILKNLSNIHLIDIDHERIISKNKLAKFFLETKVEMENDLFSSIKKAMHISSVNNEILIIAGSFFIMNDVYNIIFDNKN